MQYAKVHIFAGSYPETVATFDDIPEWESTLAASPEPYKMLASKGAQLTSSAQQAQAQAQQQQLLLQQPQTPIALGANGNDNLIIDDYIKTSKHQPPQQISPTTPKRRGGGTGTTAVAATPITTTTAAAAAAVVSPKEKKKKKEKKEKKGKRAYDHPGGSGADENGESSEHGYAEALFGRDLRGAAAASLLASRLPNGVELDAAQQQRLTEGYARVLERGGFGGGVVVLGRSRKGMATGRLFSALTSEAFRSAGVLCLRLQSVWDAGALLRALFECDAETPVPLVMVGESACLGCVLRPYLDLIAKRPLHSKPVEFYFVPVARRNTCEAAALLAARDPEYRTLFCDELWERQVVAQLAARDGVPNAALVEERVLRYMRGARAETILSIGEATLTQQQTQQA